VVESDKCWGQSARRVFEKSPRDARILLGVKKVVVEARVKSCEANSGVSGEIYAKYDGKCVGIFEKAYIEIVE
jgi:hypothetical protein